MIKPQKVLCKRTLKIGDDYWWDESVLPPIKVPRDNRMLVKGNWYDIVYNKNDSDETFSIIDNQKNCHLFWMYEDDRSHNLPRTYAKWFYTPIELELRAVRQMKLKNNC